MNKSLICGIDSSVQNSVMEIRKLIFKGVPQKEIAELYSVTSANISYVKANKIWRQ